MSYEETMKGLESEPRKLKPGDLDQNCKGNVLITDWLFAEVLWELKKELIRLSSKPNCRKEEEELRHLIQKVESLSEYQRF
jgi:hypothetical protein